MAWVSQLGEPKKTNDGCCWKCRSWSKKRVLVEHTAPVSCSGEDIYYEPWCLHCWENRKS